MASLRRRPVRRREGRPTCCFEARGPHRELGGRAVDRVGRTLLLVFLLALSLFLLSLTLLLAACVPGASVVSPPAFQLCSGALVRLEPPGVGRGAAVVRLELDVRNPNPIGVEIAGLDGDLHLAGIGGLLP